MRITGGRARGILLTAGSGRALRPATDYLREALFSSLGPWVEGRIFLDLFAGTGAYGLEALSRGARSGVFVEKNAQTADVLRRNLRSVLRSLGKDLPTGKVLCGDVRHCRFDEPFDLVFLDPPFALSRAEAPALLARAFALLKNGGRICCELPSDRAAPSHDGLQLLRRIGQRTGQSPSVALYEK